MTHNRIEEVTKLLNNKKILKKKKKKTTILLIYSLHWTIMQGSHKNIGQEQLRFRET